MAACVARTKMHAVAVALLLTVAIQTSAQEAVCSGDACLENQRAARQAGRLGAEYTCTPKDYPVGGKLSPLTMVNGVYDVHFTGEDPERNKYVFLVSERPVARSGRRLWRSAEYGRADTFVDITDQLPGAGQPEGGEPSYYYTGVVEMHYSPHSPGKFLFQGAGYRYWKTEDYGATFKAVDAPGHTLGLYHTLRLHPNQGDWVLALTRRNECNQGGSSVFSKWCAFDLFVSQDFGDSWTNLTANSNGYIASFKDFDWGASMHRGVRQDVVDTTILATAYENPDHMKGPYSGWDHDQHFVISHDFFKAQHQKVVSCGNQFEIVGDKVYMALPTSCPQFPDGGKRDTCTHPASGSVLLYISTDEAQTFTQACIPARDLDRSYQMLHTHDGKGSFVMIDHDEEDWVPAVAPISNVYADEEGTALFSLSLPRAYRSNGLVDFGRVEGIPGVFIANQISLDALESDTYDYDFEKFISTKVSFNGGSNWQDVAKPDTFRYASCDRCSGLADPSQCKLHFHGPASYYYGPGSRPSFYSHYGAPGVVLAVGNTGGTLDLAADNACTWLSNDAGLTWQDIAEKPNIYEVGDQGGVILIGNYQTQEPADRLRFSLDQGNCWHDILFSEAIDIVNIRVEPRAASRMFIVHGRACRKTDEYPTCTHENDHAYPAGKLYSIDIQAILGEDFRECKEDEYELWSPPSPEQCLLGRNFTLHRRKPAAACFHTHGWERPDNTSHPCSCQQTDLACEYGYEWSGTECVQMPGVDPTQCPSLQTGNYTMSDSHKRLIQGTVCQGVERLINDTDGRGNVVPTHGGGSPWSLWLGIAVGVAAVIAVGFLGWKAATDDAWKEQIIAAEMGTAAWFRGMYGWAREKITGQSTSPADDYFEPLPGSDDFALNLDAEDLRSPPMRQN